MIRTSLLVPICILAAGTAMADTYAVILTGNGNDGGRLASSLYRLHPTLLQ